MTLQTSKIDKLIITMALLKNSFLFHLKKYQ